MTMWGNDLYVAGEFSRIGGVSANKIARWDGTNWTALGSGVLGNYVRALCVHQGQLCVGGLFTNAGGVLASNVVRWNGRQWSPLSEGVNSTVFALGSSGSRLYAGGHLTVAGTTSANHIAQWDGSDWSALSSGVTKQSGVSGGESRESGVVFALANRGSELFVGGEFDFAGGIGITNLARWDGAAWSRVAEVSGQEPHTLAVQGDYLFAATSAQLLDTRVTRIGRWNGNDWSLLQGQVGEYQDAIVAGMAVNGTDLFVAGYDFARMGEVPASAIARWDGTAWSGLGSGVSDSQRPCCVLALAAHGHELFVGGFFNQAGGQPANNLARWRIPHPLNIQRQGSAAQLSWPATGSNLVLESTLVLVPTNWKPLPEGATPAGDQLVITQHNAGDSQFFRLRGR